MATTTTLTLELVKETLDLYKEAFNKYPHVKNLASELSVKSTILMKFIKEHEVNFYLDNCNSGCYIKGVYPDLKDKKDSDEYVAYQKELHKKDIWLDTHYYDYTKDVSCYTWASSIYGEKRFKEWGNTPEKARLLDEYFKEDSFINGGLGDSYRKTYKNTISKANMENLKQQGWNFIIIP